MRNIKKGGVLYYRKEKSQGLFEIPGVQFPDNLNSLDSNIIIRRSGAFVKPSAEKIRQIRRLFVFSDKPIGAFRRKIKGGNVGKYQKLTLLPKKT